MKFLIFILVMLFPFQAVVAGVGGTGIIHKSMDKSTVTPEGAAQMEENNRMIAESLTKLSKSLEKVKAVYASLEERLKDEKKLVTCATLASMKKDIDDVKIKFKAMEIPENQYKEDLELYTKSYEEYKKDLEKNKIKCAK